MTTHVRLLAISVAVSGVGLSAASAAGTSKDAWKGAWKFEIDRQDQPSLNYYDSRGKTVFRIGCGAHFDMRAVYPGAAKQDDTKASITIANGKMQMDFAGVVDTQYRVRPAAHHDVRSAGPRLRPRRSRALRRQMARAGKSRLRSSGLRAAADDLGRGQKLRAAAGQRASLAGALSENLLTRQSAVPRQNGPRFLGSVLGWRLP